MNFNEKLIQLRKEKGLSQEQLAERLEVSRQAISKWETAEAKPDMEKLMLLGKNLDVTLDELCGKDGGNSKKNSETPVPSMKSKKHLWISGGVLLLVFIIGMIGGYLIAGSQYVTGEDIRDIKIANFSYSFQPKDSATGKMSVKLNIIPSSYSNGTKAKILKVTNTGETVTYFAEYLNGAFICTVTANNYEEFTLSAVFYQKDREMAAGLMKVSIRDNSFECQEIWDK